MKERPIMFKAEMVRAMLEGRKTQTRRPVKPQPPKHVAGLRPYYGQPNRWIDAEGSNYEIKCPFGVPGDRLWVRETWKDFFKRTPENNGCSYLADYGYRLDLVSNEQARLNWKWRSAMFMPRWASRITLEIVSVRVDRVQSITEEDAIAEGVDAVSMADVPRQATMSRRSDFAQLWDRLYLKSPKHIRRRKSSSKPTDRFDATHAPNSPLAWALNPWVWVVEFQQVNESRGGGR